MLKLIKKKPQTTFELADRLYAGKKNVTHKRQGVHVLLNRLRKKGVQIVKSERIGPYPITIKLK